MRFTQSSQRLKVATDFAAIHRMRLRKLNLEEMPPMMLAFSGILGIGPMAVYRLIEGSYVVAAVNMVAVTCFAAIAWSIYVLHATRFASICMALVAISAAVTTINIRGGDQFVWIYPVCVALFYLLKPKEAVIASVIAIGLIVPVVVEDAQSGKIALFLASLAVTISLSVAFAAMTAAQRRELQATALLDPLTGIGNRRAFDRKLDSAIAQSESDGTNFVLIVLDIDHFKSVNDLHGHAVGDLVLCNVADTIESNIRAIDSCFRAGGEEFVVIANASDLQHARKLAERLRVAIHDSQNSVSGAPETVRVTASFGLAEYLSGESHDAIFKRADDALYEAKRSGRNRLHYSERTVSLSGTASYEAIPDKTSHHDIKSRIVEPLSS